ncbi:SDR family NAD(P)-dependent oxidoreductase, partial [Pseudomonas aeruginosa]|nr:SDR family NAD(P)-dependent oxidoreductase [Pseudomonas aeruginosa]
MKIGVIGGGQLGRMLALAGTPLGMNFAFLDPAPDACAASLGEHIRADYGDQEHLRQLADEVDLVTFEFESVPAETVAFLSQFVPVYPNAESLRIARDRWFEKSMFKDLGIPTPDVWVNAAMVTLFSPVRQLTAEEIRRVTEVTYLGTVHGTLAALERMRPRDHGVIIQVGSALAYRAIPLQAAYCAAKFAVRGFTDALRCELLEEGSGIRLCMVQLPALDTPQFDWARNRLPRKPQPVP